MLLLTLTTKFEAHQNIMSAVDDIWAQMKAGSGAVSNRKSVASMVNSMNKKRASVPLKVSPPHHLPTTNKKA